MWLFGKPQVNRPDHTSFLGSLIPISKPSHISESTLGRFKLRNWANAEGPYRHDCPALGTGAGFRGCCGCGEPTGKRHIFRNLGMPLI